MSSYFFDSEIDIKLIILFILKNFKAPASDAEISDIIVENNFADYFSIASCLVELTETGLIFRRQYDEGAKLVLAPLGEDAAKDFTKSLPFTVRERLLLSIKQAKTARKESDEIVAEYTKVNEMEYRTDCKILEQGFEIFSLSFSVATLEAAQKITRMFKKDPELVYRNILHLLME